MAKIRRVLSAVALSILFLGLTTLSVSGQRSGRSSGGRPSGRTTSAPKTVQVKGYTRKDGTYVAPYDRAARGTAWSSSSAGYSFSTPSYLYGGTSKNGDARDENGRIQRSVAARSAFMRMRPCPATGGSSGVCPGYVVDHIVPLANGGADDPSNMQWQTVEEAKAKDKWERKGGSYVNPYPWTTTPTYTYLTPSRDTSTYTYREPSVAPAPVESSDSLESYFDKVDRQSRVREADRLRELGYDVKWQDHTYFEMSDWESRIRQADRLRGLGLDVKWQEHTYFEMSDWESRIRQANRLRSKGINVDWTKYTYFQLAEMDRLRF